MLNCCTFKENGVELSLWGKTILFPCYLMCGISYYLALTFLNTRFGDVDISKPLPQFCIIFRASLFSWLSFKTVIYFITLQRIIFFLFSDSARLEDLGNSGEKSHAEPLERELQQYLAARNGCHRIFQMIPLAS